MRGYTMSKRSWLIESALNAAAEKAVNAILAAYEEAGGNDFIAFVIVLQPLGFNREPAIFRRFHGDATKMNRRYVYGALWEYAYWWPSSFALFGARQARVKNYANDRNDIVFGIIPLYRQHASFGEDGVEKLTEQIKNIFDQAFIQYAVDNVELEYGAGNYLCPEWTGGMAE